MDGIILSRYLTVVHLKSRKGAEARHVELKMGVYERAGQSGWLGGGKHLGSSVHVCCSFSQAVHELLDLAMRVSGFIDSLWLSWATDQNLRV